MTSSSERCSVCRAPLSAVHITYTQEVAGRVFIIREVPADVCPQCGEQYLAPDTVDGIQALVEYGGIDKVLEITHVPVYRFAPAPLRR